MQKPNYKDSALVGALDESGECGTCALVSEGRELLREVFVGTRLHRDTRIPACVLSEELAAALGASGIQTFGELSSIGIGQLVSRLGAANASEAVHACSWLSPSSSSLFDWVGLVSRILDLSDDRYLAILRARSFQDPAGRRFVGRGSSIVIGRELNLSAGRVRQLGFEAWKELCMRVGDHRILIYQQALATLEPHLGTLWTPEALEVPAALVGLVSVEPDLHIQQLGPYGADGGWWYRRGTKCDPRSMRSVVKEGGPGSEEAVVGRLVAKGMTGPMATRFVASIPELSSLRGDLYWVDADFGSRAAWELQGADRPLSMSVLLERVGGGRGARRAIQTDSRISRVGRDRYALRKWGITEYHGLASAIRVAVETGGGSIPFSALVEDLVDRFAVSPSSVAVYANGGDFVTKDGVVRFRTEADSHVASSKPLSLERQCFRMASGSWALAVTVDHDVRRGSGRSVPLSWIQQFDVPKGQKKRIDLDGGGRLTLSRRSLQPTIGSIRLKAAELDATDGDLLFIVPETVDRAGITRVPESDINLMSAIGRPADPVDPLIVVSTLGSDNGGTWADVRALCRARGDEGLLGLVPGDPALDGPDELAALLGLGL